MKLPCFRAIFTLRASSAGFTLAELLIALAIGGMVLAGASMTIHQLFLTGARNENYMIAVRQVQNAGYWISRDGVSAQSITPGSSSGFPLTLSWSEWGSGVTTNITYTISDGNLSRQETGGTTIQAVIARHIVSAMATFPTIEGTEVEQVLTVTITAQVGAASESRTYKIKPRPVS